MESYFTPVRIHIPPLSDPPQQCTRVLPLPNFVVSAMISLVPQTFLVNGNCLYLLYACLVWAEMIKMLKGSKIGQGNGLLILPCLAMDVRCMLHNIDVVVSLSCTSIFN